MKDKYKNILKSIGIILLLVLFSSIFFAIFNININNISDKDYVIYLTLSNILLLLIFIYIYRKTLIHDIKDYFKNFKKYFKVSIVYWIIGVVIMILVNAIITNILHKPISTNDIKARNLINYSPILMAFNTIIYAPICEELTFRKSIKDTTKNKLLFLIISSLLFSFLHVLGYINYPIDYIYLIPYLSLGIAFALLYYKTNNIFTTIIMHSFHNLIAIILYLIGVSL